MSMTDPIADLLTRMRNAVMRKHAEVVVPASRVKKSILDLLVREGYISGVTPVTPEGGHPSLKVDLKYVEGRSAIEGLTRVSTPGLRRYIAKDEIPWVQGGYGVAIISTSRGVMTDREARRQGIGGELLCTVW